MEKTRIWELDIVRGVCLLGVFLSHFYFDLTMFWDLSWILPRWVSLLFQYGGILFVLLSGICVTLGSHPLRRGGIVFSCAMLITLATWLAGKVLGDPTLCVRFGILHLLGLCMLLYPLFGRLPNWLLTPLSLAIVFLGYWFETLRVQTAFLFPLGLITRTFSSSDFWPLFPQLGFFLLGVVLGCTLYRERRPRIPALQGRLRPLAFCGRHSLELYLLQQPVLIAILFLLSKCF